MILFVIALLGVGRADGTPRSSSPRLVARRATDRAIPAARGRVMGALAQVPMPPVTATTVHELVRLLVDAERRLAAGPWDRWDERVLVAYRDAARDTLNLALRYL